MSWGEESCKLKKCCPIPNKRAWDTCNTHCDMYVWDSEIMPTNSNGEFKIMKNILKYRKDIKTRGENK